MKRYSVRILETQGDNIGRWGGWSGTFHHLKELITWADDHLPQYMRGAEQRRFAVFCNGKLIKKLLPLPDPPAKPKGR